MNYIKVRKKLEGNKNKKSLKPQYGRIFVCGIVEVMKHFFKLWSFYHNTNLTQILRQ